MLPFSGIERGGPAVKISLLTVLFASEILVVLLFQAPHQTFVRFAAMDSGGELAIQNLVSRHYRPGIDFGYPYGLLALWLGRIWYTVAGLSPRSYQIYVFLVSLFSAWGLARLVVARNISRAGVALILLAIPDLIFVTYLTSVQTIEQALLINALAEQAKGRRGSAFALLTACCFIKPSLAFVQGLAVLSAIIIRSWRSSRWLGMRSLVPALLTGGGLALLLAGWFSPLALVQTLSPATGAAIYRANHYGFFFGQGRAFWILPAGGLRDYFRYEVGFWLVGTLFLAWGVLSGCWRLSRRSLTSEQATDEELIITAGFVHFLFVFFLFGHRWTWTYSLPMLIIGLAMLGNRGPGFRLILMIMVGLLGVSDRSKAVATLEKWRTESTHRTMHDLWSTAREAAEWARVLELTRHEHPVPFSMCEGGSILFPEFAEPEVGYLVPGNLRPGELARKTRQLTAAQWIVTYGLPKPDGFESWNQFEAAFQGCEVLFEGQFFKVHRRRSVR